MINRKSHPRWWVQEPGALAPRYVEPFAFQGTAERRSASEVSAYLSSLFLPSPQHLSYVGARRPKLLGKVLWRAGDGTSLGIQIPHVSSRCTCWPVKSQVTRYASVFQPALFLVSVVDSNYACSYWGNVLNQWVCLSHGGAAEFKLSRCTSELNFMSWAESFKFTFQRLRHVIVSFAVLIRAGEFLEKE